MKTYEVIAWKNKNAFSVFQLSIFCIIFNRTYKALLCSRENQQSDQLSWCKDLFVFFNPISNASSSLEWKRFIANAADKVFPGS